ncbi:hypothetical protein K501DRAFT_274822 [Backusella circina FSU 941]|nr:hypothetical protein K501DRAFT_274822 [Backusella circina FSU 941]
MLENDNNVVPVVRNNFCVLTLYYNNIQVFILFYVIYEYNEFPVVESDTSTITWFDVQIYELFQLVGFESDLWDKKNRFNKRWKAMMEVEANLKEKRKGGSVAFDSIVEPKMRHISNDQWDKVVVSGLDPGVVSTAVLTFSRFENLYEGINRYQVLSESDVQSDASVSERKMHDWTLNLTANQLYSSYHAAIRETAKVPVLNFSGSWNRITTGMKGHMSRKLKPLLDRMK